ncbi:MAG: hypothetical protein GX838_04650, partial [Clostridiaceae bacterium]|nr:hypothetical protein [Clostridiaceae bacterium]
MDSQDVKKKRRSPSFAIALVPLLTLDGLLCYLVYKGERELHLGIILAAFLATLITMVFYRTPWGRIEDAILKSSYTGLQVILFFLLAILFNSYWLRSGILPTLVYYGGNLLPPAVFPYVTLLVFALVSFATGSSWVSIGMLGPAFMTIAALLGQPQAMTAGVILSGAFLGDRLSPLALNNYLAASVTGAPLADHIKQSLVTAIPSLAAVVAA